MGAVAEDAVSPLCCSLACHNHSSSSGPISLEPGKTWLPPLPIPLQRDASSGCDSEAKMKGSGLSGCVVFLAVGPLKALLGQ